VVDEVLDLGCAHLCGVAFVVKEDVAASPVEIGLFGAVGVVFGADGIAHAVEEFFVLGGGCDHGGIDFCVEVSIMSCDGDDYFCCLGGRVRE